MEKYKTLYPDQVHILVYDELLKDPESETRKLAEFLEIDFDLSLIQPTILGESWGGNSSVDTDGFKAIDKAPLFHWKKNITKQEIGLVNKYFDWVLQKYGFEQLDGNLSQIAPFHHTEKFKVYLANKYLSLKPGTHP